MASSVPGGVSALPLRNFYESTSPKLLCVLPTASNPPVKGATLSFRSLSSSLRHPYMVRAASGLVVDEVAVENLPEAETGPESVEVGSDIAGVLPLPLSEDAERTFRCTNSPPLPPSFPKEKPTICKNFQDMLEQSPSKNSTPLELPDELSSSIESRRILLCAASLGFALLLMGLDENSKALALGPEGPLVEEFWDNVRRYGLYALTVSTGAIYTILEPIVELLKNPLSALLLILIIGGSGYLIYQVLSAMFGISDFSYDYAN
ncbi:uncharacterized protein LOC116255131 [Nymphaea colorata]|nr:uncharacterized protein LOC116255131 [Nymphaea colorata]